MRPFSILCLLSLIGCSTAKQAGDPAPARLRTNSTGEPYGLRFEDGALAFCDSQGGRRLDLKTGQAAVAQIECKKEEANTACSGLSLDVTVSAPSAEPNDVVDVGGSSFPMKGRVHDCATDGKALAVVTNSRVVLIRPANGTSVEVNAEGGDRVAINSRWVAWADGSSVNVVLRAELDKK